MDDLVKELRDAQNATKNAHFQYAVDDMVDGFEYLKAALIRMILLHDGFEKDAESVYKQAREALSFASENGDTLEDQRREQCKDAASAFQAVADETSPNCDGEKS